MRHTVHYYKIFFNKKNRFLRGWMTSFYHIHLDPFIRFSIFFLVYLLRFVMYYFELLNLCIYFLSLFHLCSDLPFPTISLPITPLCSLLFIVFVYNLFVFFLIFEINILTFGLKYEIPDTLMAWTSM